MTREPEAVGVELILSLNAAKNFDFSFPLTLVDQLQLTPTDIDE
jgi:hypothetical protein